MTREEENKPEPWNLMPSWRVRTIRRLRLDGFSVATIAAMVECSPTTVMRYLSDPSLKGKEGWSRLD